MTSPITEDAERELRARASCRSRMLLIPRADLVPLLAAFDEARARADWAEAALDRRRSTFDDSPLFGDKGSAAERGE